MSKEMRQHINNFNKFRLSENLNISDVRDSEKYLIKRLIDRLSKLENGDLSLSKLTYRLSMVDDILSDYSDDFLKEKINRDVNEYF